MIVKSTGLALIAVVGLLGVAHAQTSGPATPATNGSSPSTTTSGAAPTVGWYYVHPTQCLMTFDGTYAWLVVIPAEGGSWWTAFPPSQELMTPTCQNGNWVAFYVDNVGFAGHWSNFLTFNYR